MINVQAYENDEELEGAIIIIIIKSSEIKQNKTSKQKKKIPSMAEPIDVRNFLSTSHNNDKETY